MAQQLVYTSAPKLLDAGRSGFGTVARSKSLTPLLVSAIERVSQFANIRGTERSRVIFVHRRIVAANHRIHLLSRIADAGADYTGRTNHIAHHLIVPQEEMTRLAARGITPADALLQFQWLTRWDGAPKYFGPDEDLPLELTIQPHGVQSARSSWTRLTGNPFHARLLAWDSAPRNGVLLVPHGSDTLALLAEALAEFGTQSWSRTFTTNLETTDEMSDFDWVVSSPENFREIESRCGARHRLDLSLPQSLPIPPEPAQASPKMVPAPQPGHQSSGMTEVSGQIPDAGKRQADYVQIQLSVSDASSPHRAISNPASSRPRKARMPMILAGAAMVALLAVLSIAAWKTNGPKDQNNVKTSEIQRESDKKAAEGILKEKIPEDQIQIFINSVGEDLKGWADFTNHSIDAVQGNDPLSELARLEIPKGHRPIEPSWVVSLVDARDIACELAENGKNTTLGKRNSGVQLELIVAISKNIKEAAKILNFKTDKFSVSCQKPIKELVKEAIDNKQALELTEEVVNNLFNQENKIVFNRILQYLKNPESDTTLTDDEIQKIVDAAFIPDNLKELLKNRAETSHLHEATSHQSLEQKHTLADKSDDPDLSGVPAKEIIIVTRKQLQEGVDIALLKASMSENASQNDLKKNLKIDGKEINLVSVDKQEYFSEHYIHERNNTNRKLYKNGKFSWANPDVMEVSISAVSRGKSCDALIVIDEVVSDREGANKPLENLSFSLEPSGEDKVKLAGKIVEAIEMVAEGKNQIELIVSIAGHILKKEGKDYYLAREPNATPLLLADSDIEEVNKALNNYENQKNIINSRSNRSQKNKNEETKKLPGYRDALGDALLMAIGGAIIRRDLNIEKNQKIEQKHWEGAKKILTEMNIARTSSYTEWEKDLADIKKQIGTRELGPMLQKEIRNLPKFDGWDDFANNYDPTNAVKSLMQKFKAYRETSYFEELNGVSTCTVKTKRGRLLFKAKRKP